VAPRIGPFGFYMSIRYPTLSSVLAEFERKEAANGIWVPRSNIRYFRSNPTRALCGVAHDGKKIQKKTVEKAMDLLCADAWAYAYKEGRMVGRLKSVWQEVMESCGCNVPFHTCNPLLSPDLS
jgi:hypothetical protein